MARVPVRYIPNTLSRKDSKFVRGQLKKSRKLYKKGKYHTRKKVSSFKSKVSPHILKAKEMYKLNDIKADKNLSRNWGRARLASSVTGGKASAVDIKILKEGCHKNSKALKLAKKAYIKYNKGSRKVKKTKL